MKRISQINIRSFKLFAHHPYVILMYCTYPVKDVTRILMEILYHFISQIDDSLIEIETKFYEYPMSIVQVLFVFHAKTWHGFWTKSSHAISMAFSKNMAEFSTDLVSFSTKLPSKIHEKICVIFCTGLF